MGLKIERLIALNIVQHPSNHPNLTWHDKIIHNNNIKLELIRQTPGLFEWYPPLNFLILIKGKIISMLCTIFPNTIPNSIAKINGEHVKSVLYKA